MLRLVSAITLLVVPTSVFAAKPVTFVDKTNNAPFEYLTSIAPNGVITIAGNYLPSGETFDLAVEPSGRVHGVVSQDRVEFFVEKAKRDAIAAQLQASPAVTAANSVQMMSVAAQ